MNYIDLNDIGRSLFKQRYNVKDKHKLTFNELGWYIDDVLYHYKISCENIIHSSRERKDFINSLNNLLLLCYLNNVDLNKYIQLTVKENEEIK